MKTSHWHWQAKQNGWFMLVNPAVTKTNDFIAISKTNTETEINIQEIK